MGLNGEMSAHMDNALDGVRRRGRLHRVFFGDDRRVELACKRTLMASLVCMVWTLIALMAYLVGNVSPMGFAAIATFSVGGVLLFNVAIRSGWSLRFEDVGLTQAQMIFATLCMSGIYALIPPTRAAVLQTMCLTLVFGTFSLTAQQSIRMGVILACCPLATVLILALIQSETYSFGVDGVPALGVAAIMLAMSRLLSHFCKLRETLKGQRNQLQELVDQTARMAMTDELTGLLNRRRVTELSELALSRHARSATPVCLALLDIDRFKQVNDQYGHHIGDEVLVSVARALGQGVRTTDILARWGGEEFLVLLPDSVAHDAKVVLDRVLEKLKTCSASASQPQIRVTFSTGVAQWDGVETLDALVERADRAMYRAKDGGRSQCVLA